MSNSQNKKNEQQNNLCITLTEQWKKGELKSGWYFVKVGNYEAEIDLYDDDQNQWFNCCDKDIYPVEILAPVPSYEEYQQLHKWCEEFNALDVAKENQRLQMSLRMTVDDYKNVVDICEQLKELLKECKDVLLSYSNISGDYELYDKITNAIGEKK